MIIGEKGVIRMTIKWTSILHDDYYMRLWYETYLQFC